MREVVALALAKHKGQLLTTEVAKEILRDLEPVDQSIDPQKFGQVVSGSLVIRAERFRDILSELESLHEAHYEETEKHRQGLKLIPDVQGALADERAGALVQITARHAGRLVGNLRVYIRTSRHTSTRYMVEDTLYLLPEYRRGRAAVRMLQFMEQSMRLLGVLEMRATTKAVNRTDKLLEFMGWQPVATELVKFLKE